MKTLRFIAIILFSAIISQAAYGQSGVDKPQYQILTKRAGNFLGTFNIELFPLIAPLHVNNFDSLVSEQFFDSTAFHRVVPGFVIQGGDPNSISGPVSTWGQGQPWQPTVNAEFNAVRHYRGILGAARDSDPNSANSQFYICVANAFSLDGNYTVYGKVINGMDVVDTIVASPRDINDVPLQKIEMFVTYTGVNDSVPSATTLLSPADGTTGVLNTQVYTFNPVPGAVLYHVDFSTDPNFSTIEATITTGTNAASFLQCQGFTTYYWRVTANNGGHLSPVSGTFSFTTATGAPALIYPQDGATGITVDPTFIWSSPAGATDYTLQVSKSNIFTTQNMVYNQSGIVDTFQTVTGLNPNFTYYWRVRSANGSTQGFYSGKLSFTTGTGTSINEFEDVNNGMSLYNIYPNPVSDRLRFDLKVTEKNTISVSIYDLNERRVYHEDKTMLPGITSCELDLRNISPASYLLVISSYKGLISRPFQIIR